MEKLNGGTWTCADEEARSKARVAIRIGERRD